MKGQCDELGDTRLIVGDEHERLTVQVAEPPWASRLPVECQFSDLARLSNTLQLQWLFQFAAVATRRDNVVVRSLTLLRSAGTDA
jgi:hypothetical protein